MLSWVDVKSEQVSLESFAEDGEWILHSLQHKVVVLIPLLGARPIQEQKKSPL